MPPLGHRRALECVWAVLGFDLIWGSAHAFIDTFYRGALITCIYCVSGTICHTWTPACFNLQTLDLASDKHKDWYTHSARPPGCQQRSVLLRRADTISRRQAGRRGAESKRFCRNRKKEQTVPAPLVLPATWLRISHSDCNQVCPPLKGSKRAGNYFKKLIKFAFAYN